VFLILKTEDCIITVKSQEFEQIKYLYWKKNGGEHAWWITLYIFFKRMANECRDGFFGINDVYEYKAAKKRLLPPSENLFSFDTIIDNAYKQP